MNLSQLMLRVARFVRETRFALLLLAAICMGCGGGKEDFSKPVIPPKPNGDSQAGPSKPQPDPASTSKKVGGREDDSGESNAQLNVAKTASTKTGKDDAEEDAEPPAFDLKWLTEREQHTAISHDGRLLAVGSKTGSLRVFDVEAGAISQLFPDQPGGLSALAINSKGTELASASSDGQVRFWSNVAVAAGFDEYHQLGLRNDPRQRGYGAHLGSLTALDYHPAGKGFVTAGTDGAVKLWRYPPTPPLAVALGEFGHTTLAVNGTNEMAATVTADGEFSLWDIEKQEKLRSFMGSDVPYTRLLFLPESNWLLAGSASGVLTAIRPTDGVVMTRLLGHQGAIAVLELANEGKAVLSADAAGEVRLWNLPLTPSIRLAKFAQSVELLRQSSDQRYGAVLLKDKSLMLFEARGNGLPRTLSGQNSDVRVFEFSNDSTVIAAGTATGVVRLWSVASGQLVGEMSAQETAVRTLAFHPREKLIAIGSEDGRTQLTAWPDQTTGLDGTQKSVAWLRSSPNGKLLASIDFNADLRIWSGDEPKPVVTKSLSDFGTITALAVGDALIGVANHLGQVLLVSPQEVGREEILSLSSLGLIELGFDAVGESVIGLDSRGSVHSAWVPCMFLSLEQKQQGVGVSSEDFATLGRLERGTAAVATDGSWIARVLPDHLLQIRSTKADGATIELKLDATPSHVAIAAGGKAVAVTVGKEVRVLAPSGKVLDRTKLDRENSAIAFDGLTTRLAWPGQKRPQGSGRRLDLKLDGSIDALAMSSDGKLLAVGNSTGTVRLVLADAGEEIAKFDADRVGIRRLAFSLDNKLLHGTTRDQRALQWQLETKELVAQTNLGAASLDASLLADARSIAVLGADHSLRLVAASTAGVLQELELSLPQRATTPDVTVKSDAPARPNSPTKSAVETSNIASVHSNLNAGTVWLGGSDGSVWEHVPAATRVLRPHDDQGVKDAILVTRSTYLASVSQGDVVTLHQLSGQVIRKFEGHGGNVIGIAPVKNGTQIAAAVEQGGKGKLCLWSIADGELIGELPLWSVPHRLIRDDDAGRFLLLDRKKHLHVYDSATVHLRERIESIDEVADGAIASRLNAFLTTEGDGAIRRYPSQVLKLMPGLTEPATTVAWSSDGSQVLAGTNGKVMLWDAETGSVTQALKVGATAVTATRLGGAGHLCVAGQNGSVKVWKLESLIAEKEDAEPQMIFQHPGAVFALAFSADGKQLATGGQESVVRIWDVAKGKELAQMVGHSGPIQSIEFDNTQEKLLSTGADRSARVWSLNTVKTGALDDKAPPAKISDAISSIPNISVNGSELQQSLEKNLTNSKDDASRARIRAMIRQVNTEPTEASKVINSADANGRTEMLRSMLRQANSPQTREKVRQQLLVSLREDELRRSMTAARTDIERRAIRKSLDALRDARRPDGSENPQNDADVWHQLDRKWCAGNADERMKLKTDLEELTKSKPIWPRAADATKRNNEQSHLLTTIPTNFEFDEKIFRRVELALSRDELSLAAARESAALSDDRRVEGSVRVWDVPSRTELRSWSDVEKGALKAIQFDPSGQTILTIPDVFGFELSSGHSRAVARAATVTLSSDGQLALLGHRGKERGLGDALTLLEVTSLQSRPARFQAYESTVPALAISPDGRLVAACIRERAKHRLLLIDADSLSIRRVLEEFTHRDSWLNPTGEVIPGITQLQFSPDGQLLIAYGQYSTDEFRLISFQVKDGKSVVAKRDTPLPRGDSLRPFVFVAGKSLMAIEAVPALMIVDTKENRVVREIPWNESPSGRRVHAIASDGSTLAFGDAAGEVELLRLDRDDAPQRFRAHEGPMVGIAFSTSNHTLITAGEENQVRLWTLAAFHHTRVAAPSTKGKTSPKKGLK